MTWTPETSCGHESAKIASVAVPYLQGQFLDLGCGVEPVWPSAICVDSGGTFGGNTVGIRHDIADLPMFADGCMDAVFSSHALEDFERERVPTVLTEWARVLKVGGYLVLYVPSANLYPRLGQPGANPAHRWDIYPGDLERMLREEASATCGWELVESEERGETNEYSLFVVAKKLAEPGEWRENVWQRNPEGKKRCLLIRYGAIGDAIQVSSVFPLIKEQGYHLTVNCKPETKEILKHDPNVDEWIAQGDNFVPNMQLGPYWESIAPRYDRVINLCESVEGAMLMLPGRLTHQYPEDVRRALVGKVSYLERTHDIAGVPHRFNPRFYPSDEEKAWAEATYKEFGGNAPIILWAIAGSSHHKIYPYVPVVLLQILEKTPCHVVLTGDDRQGASLQSGMIESMAGRGGDMSRLHPMAGKWTIRQTMAFAQQCDLIVGPETGVLNGVSLEENPKIVYLSHSSADNLTKHWANTVTLIPDKDLAPCHPCHRLHYTWDYCFQDERTHAAKCAAAVHPEMVMQAILFSFNKWQRVAA